MFCENCGEELVDNAKFCPKCGEPVTEGYLEGSADPQATASEPADSQANTPDSDDSQAAMPKPADPQATMPVSTEEDSVQKQKEPSPKKKRTAIIASTIAVVVIAAVAIGVFVFVQQQQQREYEEAHRTSLVTLAFNLPDYGPDEGTGVPVLVEGTDLDGEAVAEQFVFSASGGEVELKRGTYHVHVAGSPVTGTGRIYKFPNQTVDLAIGESGISVTGGVDHPTFDFEIIPAQDVTDEQITDIREWLSEYGFSDEEVNAIVTQVTDARQAEQERIAEEQRRAEEEARRKAEEEARQRQAALTAEAFSSSPKLVFSSGVDGWRTLMTVNSDGTFTGEWTDSDMGVTGPGYPKGTLMRTPFVGKFTVLEKASDTDYVLQLDYLRGTEPEHEVIQDGQKVEYHTGSVVGLGPMTETPVSGWHYYLPGQSTSSISEVALLTLPASSNYKPGDATLTQVALCNDENGWGPSRI